MGRIVILPLFGEVGGRDGSVCVDYCRCSAWVESSFAGGRGCELPLYGGGGGWVGGGGVVVRVVGEGAKGVLGMLDAKGTASGAAYGRNYR